MVDYVIRAYQPGFEVEQARIGYEVAHNWAWPYAHSLNDLLKIHARSDFDPDTRHYCFLDDEMVGYMFSTIFPVDTDGLVTAHLDFPRVRPGHDSAVELLLRAAFDVYKKRRVSRVMGHVTTMSPRTIDLAEKQGFTLKDWGFKVYYSYEMSWGALSQSSDHMVEISPEEDLTEWAILAAHWYKCSAECCHERLQAFYGAGIITHLGVVESGRKVAAGLVARNDVRPSTAGIMYIYTPDEYYLTVLLAKMVDACCAYGVRNIIADLIHEQRQYETVYQRLGFKKVAEWARCEMILT